MFWRNVNLFHKKANIAFALANPKSKKGHKSVKFVKDLQIQTWPVFYDAFSFFKIWKSLLHPFKSYWLETTNSQFNQNLSKNGHNSVKILRITPPPPPIKLDLYFIMLDPSVKFNWNWCIPSRVILCFNSTENQLTKIA